MSRDAMRRSDREGPASRPGRGVAPRPELRFALGYLPEERRSVVLDAGCGEGRDARSLARAGYVRVTGLDVRASVDTQRLFAYRRAPLDATGLPDAYVDFVYCFWALARLPDPEKALREFHRILKPGAALVLSAPTRYSPFALGRIARRWLGGGAQARGTRLRSGREYLRMLERTGFEVLDVDGCSRGTRAAGAPRQRPSSRTGRGPGDAQRPRPERATRWLRRLRSVIGDRLMIAARKPAAASGRRG